MVIVIGLLALEPGVTLVAAVFFGSFYILFMRLTRARVRTINEVTRETSQGLSRLVQQFISGMRDIKLRDGGPYFINNIDAISNRGARAGVISAWLGGLPRNLIEPIAFTGTIVWAMAALSMGRLAQVLPTLGVMAMAGYRLLPNIQQLYNCLHLVATNRFALDELEERTRLFVTFIPGPGSKEGSASPRTDEEEPLVYRGDRTSKHHFYLFGRRTSDPSGHQSSHPKGRIDRFRGPNGIGEIDPDQHPARPV